MEGIQNIAEKIRADGRVQVNQINLESRDTMVQIFDDLEKEIKRMTLENDKRIHQEIENLHKIMESNTMLEIRNERLHVKQEILDEVFVHALNKLVQLPISERIELLLNMLKRVEFNGHETIAFCGQDKGTVAETVINDINNFFKSQGKEITVALSSRVFDSMGGFVVISEQYDLNYTFEAIVHRIRDDVEAEIVGIIFG